MHQTTEHHPAFEEYCECLYELDEDQIELIQARIADRLNVSRASVSEMIKRMQAEGLVDLTGPRIALTEKGKTLAEGVVRKHRLAECFLIDVLGLPWATAHHEACKWEHVITDEVAVALAKMLGHPTACPHGNQIPGSNYQSVPFTKLSNLEIGKSFIIVRISEELEETAGVLDSLEVNRMFPGREGVVTNKSKDGEISFLMNESGSQDSVTVSSFIGSRLLVTTRQ
jgi:DtxR family transcriptional regulator, Mn-dependent transcriptional regulator